MTDWPVAPKTEDRSDALRSAPPAVQKFNVAHRDKGTQGVYVGREEVEAELLQLIEDNVASATASMASTDDQLDKKMEESGGKGIIISAPPGAGKSTLLVHTLIKVKERGIGVIHLRHDSLATAATLNASIQSQEPWRSWIGQRGIRTKLVKVLATGTDGLMRILLQTTKDIAGVQINSDNFDVFTQLIEGWQEHKTYEAEHLLQQIDRVPPNGFVFSIDEAQQLHRHLAHDSTCATTVLNTLGDPDARRMAGITHGTIILAGLSNTEDVVGQFGSLRQRVIYLPPIQPSAVAQLIEIRIRHSGQPEAECDAAIAAWGPQLAAEFGTWTHHAQCAAYAAQRVLGTFGRDALDAEWGWPLVHREALRGVRALYKFVVRRARQAAGTIHLQTVAHAMRANSNYIDNDPMHDLIALTEQARTVNKPHPVKPAEDIIVQLLHAGLIEYAFSPNRTEDTVDDDPDPEGFRIGIPSVGKYLTATPPDAAMLKRIADCGLSADHDDDSPTA